MEGLLQPVYEVKALLSFAGALDDTAVKYP
jgi:hypothetical protein